MPSRRKGSEKKKGFGSCEYVTTSPRPDVLIGTGKAINIRVSFEEALKLNVAIDAAVHQLNEYDRRLQSGKRQGLNICLYLDKKRITLAKVVLPKPAR